MHQIFVYKKKYFQALENALSELTHSPHEGPKLLIGRWQNFKHSAATLSLFVFQFPHPSSSLSNLSVVLFFAEWDGEPKTMSLRRSILSRRTFALSKSFKEFRTLDSSESRSEPALRPRIVDGDVSDEEEEESGDGAAGDSGIRRVDSGRGDSWSTMLPELLGEIIQRVEASENRWPTRRNVVSCACVCKRWRDITREVVRSRLDSGQITFPSCLKQVQFFSFLIFKILVLCICYGFGWSSLVLMRLIYFLLLLFFPNLLWKFVIIFLGFVWKLPFVLSSFVLILDFYFYFMNFVCHSQPFLFFIFYLPLDATFPLLIEFDWCS